MKINIEIKEIALNKDQIYQCENYPEECIYLVIIKGRENMYMLPIKKDNAVHIIGLEKSVKHIFNAK